MMESSGAIIPSKNAFCSWADMTYKFYKARSTYLTFTVLLDYRLFSFSLIDRESDSIFIEDGGWGFAALDRPFLKKNHMHSLRI